MVFYRRWLLFDLWIDLWNNPMQRKSTANDENEEQQ